MILQKIIHRPIAVTMIILAVVVLGIVAVVKMPVSLMPDIDVPRVTVEVSMPGYSAAEVEGKVITPLRLQLQRVAGVKQLSSTARMDGGSITMSFEPGSDMGPLFIDVNEKVDMAMPSLPHDMERPRVVKASATDLPAFYIDISLKNEATGAGANSRFAELSDFVRNVVSRRLEQLPPVAMTDVSGLTTSEIVCTPDMNRLSALGITVDELSRALSDRNIRLQALSVRDGVYRYSVHFDSEVLTVDDVENVWLNIGGRVLQLRDLCSVAEQPATQHAIIRHNGQNCITLAVIKQADARMDDLQQQVDGVLNQLGTTYPDISFNVTRDQTELLSYTIHNLDWNLLAAAAFTLLVLLLFMRRWRLALLVAVSIPLSLIVTLLCFSIIGMSLNVISLSGLILGVGMIVDNSIIVIDNTLQKLRSGQPLATAVCKGASEVFTPMLSSVLTTCSVFLPLILVGGMAGALFFDQAMGITFALFASLVVAVLVLPVYFFAVYRKRAGAHGTPHSLQQGGGNLYKWLAPMFKWHERIQKWMFRHATICILLSALCIPGVVVMYELMNKRQLPDISHTDGLMHIDWNSGISVNENDRRTQQLVGRFKNNMLTSTSMCGSQDFLLAHTRDMSPSEAQVYFKCADKSTCQQLQDSMAHAIESQWPEAVVSFTSAGNLFDLIFSAGEPDLELRLQTINGSRPDVSEAIAFTDSLRRRFPQVLIPSVPVEDCLTLEADVEKMSIYKISYDQLRSRIEQLTGANVVMRISRGAVSVPVIIGTTGTTREQLLNATITNTDDTEVPLYLLLTERLGHDYKRLYGSVEGEYYPIDIHAGGKEVQQIVSFAHRYASAHGELKVAEAGAWYSGRDLVNKLMWVLGVSVVLLFLILASQFESLVQPLIILSEIIIDMFLVMVVLALAGQSLNVMSVTGIIVMAGIVINDSILKVDTINRHRRSGVPLLHAIALAGRERLIPIVMTSATTILAMLPFMQRGSVGADLQFPLSLAIVVGMIVGTLVSIFYVPLVYYVIYRKRSK